MSEKLARVRLPRTEGPGGQTIAATRQKEKRKSVRSPWPVVKGLTKVDADDGVVPLSWRSMQRTVYQLIEAGKTPSFAAIAQARGVSKQAVWKFFRVNPGFVAWLDAELAGENDHLIAALARRHWHIGMQGSVQSAEFFMKVVGGYFLSPLFRGEEDHAPGGKPAAVINILCPRPEIYAKAFNEVPTGLPHAGAVLPAALPPASAPVGGQTAYGVSLPTTIPVVPAKVPR